MAIIRGIASPDVKSSADIAEIGLTPTAVHSISSSMQRNEADHRMSLGGNISHEAAEND